MLVTREGSWGCVLPGLLLHQPKSGRGGENIGYISLTGSAAEAAQSEAANLQLLNVQVR